MKIAIIDDEQHAIDVMVQLIHSQKTEDNVKIHTFSSGESFLFEYSEAQRFDVIFADVEMPRINGIDLGIKIREIDPYVLIVYFTNYPSYALDAYEANPYSYLCKPICPDKFAVVWKKICQQVVRKQNEFLNLDTKFYTAKVPLSDILYIESYGHSQIIHREQSEPLKSNKTMSFFEIELDNRFYRLHRSYLVNLEKIDRIDQKNSVVLLKRGQSLPVRKENLQKLSRRYMEVMTSRSAVY